MAWTIVGRLSDEVGRPMGRGEKALLTRWDGFIDEVGRL